MTVVPARTSAETDLLSQLREQRLRVAKAVVRYPAFLPIFERLQYEIAALEAEDPLDRARALLQRAAA